MVWSDAESPPQCSSLARACPPRSPGTDFMNSELAPTVVLDAFLDAGQQASVSWLKGMLAPVPKRLSAS
jgi:hypothetical protein